MAGYRRTIWNGDAGKVWTNETDRPWYQLLCNWSNTCGVCAQYDRAVADSSWPIPFHYGCNCRQVVVPVGARAQPSVDFRETIRALPPDQRSACVGASNLKLIEAGVVSWDDVVTEHRVRDLNEVVAIKGLDVATMLKHGVRQPIAEKAFATVNTPAHQLVAAKRSQLLANIQNAGLSQPQARNLIATGLSRRLVVENGPSGRQEFGTPGTKPDQVFRLALATWAPTIVAPSPKPSPKPSPNAGKRLELEVVGDVSDEAVAEARSALDTIDDGLRRQMASFGRKVSIGRDITDFMSPDEAARRPRGWPEGTSWRNCNGVCRDGDPIVTEFYVSHHTGNKVRETNVAGVMLHELGHSVDKVFGFPSDSKGFAQAYKRDVAKLYAYDRQKLAYYVQEGEAGRSEAWAELFAWIHQRGSGSADIRTAFPKTVEWMNKFLAKPTYVDPWKRVKVET